MYIGIRIWYIMYYSYILKNQKISQKFISKNVRNFNEDNFFKFCN